MSRPSLRILVAGGFWFLLCAGILVFGTSALYWRAAATVIEGVEARPMPVRMALPERAGGVFEAVRLSGRLAPAQRTTLAFERPGTIVDLAVDEGDEVRKGDELARLDTRLLEAERARLQAERDATAADLELAQRTEQRQSRLERQGFSATQRLDEAQLGRRALEARIGSLNASLASVAVNLEKSVLKAPFAGTIGRRDVDSGAVVAAGSPAVELLETGSPEARIGIPGSLLEQLDPQTRFTVDVDGREVDARLTRIRPDRDPVTNTQIAVFNLTADGQRMPFDGLVHLDLNRWIEGAGFWAPLAILEPAERGLWQIPVAVEEVTAWRLSAVPVTVLHVAEGRAFVAGPLPEGARLVVDGAHRSEAGSLVVPAESPEGR